MCIITIVQDACASCTIIFYGDHRSTGDINRARAALENITQHLKTYVILYRETISDFEKEKQKLSSLRSFLLYLI